MNKYYRKFLVDSERVAYDLKHRRTIKFNMSKYDNAVLKGKQRYENLELAKNEIAKLKRNAIAELDKYLLQFEENISGRGAQVLWAQNSLMASQIIEEIIKLHKCKLIVKSKSMTTEEVDFNYQVQRLGVNSVETDLGEYIVQIAGEKPYHIVTPAMHKSKLDVNELFNEKFNVDINLTAEELTNFVREKLRTLYQSAEIGVTGANFIIADIGAVAVTENEGNAIMSTAFPKVHVVIAGIEKVIYSIHDLGKFWPILATHGTGQAISVYNSIFCGPKRDDEEFGPENMYVILLDNKRTDILKQRNQSDVLSCIRCGACLNACPVYRNIGGYTYDTTYSGPIGSVISPFLLNFKRASHLSYACSICGKCTEVCPSKIDLHLMLLQNRNFDIESKTTFTFFSFVMRIFKIISLKSGLFDFGNIDIKNLFFTLLVRNLFSKHRALPTFKKSFRKTYSNQ